MEAGGLGAQRAFSVGAKPVQIACSNKPEFIATSSDGVINFFLHRSHEILEF